MIHRWRTLERRASVCVDRQLALFESFMTASCYPLLFVVWSVEKALGSVYYQRTHTHTCLLWFLLFTASHWMTKELCVRLSSNVMKRFHICVSSQDNLRYFENAILSFTHHLKKKCCLIVAQASCRLGGKTTKLFSLHTWHSMCISKSVLIE